jgi:mannitol/fructose-specific phosphotransferase system IIA component (Ntr-type)
LSELAQMFSDKDLRRKLADSPDAATIYQLITRWEPNAASQRSAAI